MTCKVKAIIEVLSKILNVAPVIPNLSNELQVQLSDYIVTPANYLDISASTEGTQIILDPNEDELFNQLEDLVKSPNRYIRYKTFTELIDAISATNVSIVCISPYIRMATSLLYSGNRRVKKNVCDEYLIEAIRVIRSFRNVRVIIPKEQSILSQCKCHVLS